MTKFFEGGAFLWTIIVLFFLGAIAYLLSGKPLKALYMTGAGLVNIAVVLQ